MRQDLRIRMVNYYNDLKTRTTYKPYLAYYNRMLDIMNGKIKDKYPSTASELYVYSWKLDRMFETPRDAAKELGLSAPTVYTVLRGEQYNHYELQFLKECSKAR